MVLKLVGYCDKYNNYFLSNSAYITPIKPLEKVAIQEWVA